MRRVTKNHSKDINTELAMFEIGLFRKNGYEVIDHGDKITAVKK